MSGREPGGGAGAGSESALTPAEGFIAPEVAAEFPGLRLVWATTHARRRPSPPAVIRRLAAAADRYRGASVIAMRTKAVPRAYRGFFRQIGLDPDVQRIPGERAALERLLHGGFRSVDLINDACLIALIETSVPVYGLDADAVAAGGLGIRPVTRADLDAAVADRPPGLETGALAVADADRVHGLLFTDPDPGRAPGPRTERVMLFAVGVEGVPAVHLEEAVWIALEILAPAPRDA